MAVDNGSVSVYEQRASYSADMARKLAGIDNRGPPTPEVPAPPPTVITEDELLAKERRTRGIPLGPVPVGGVPSGVFYLRSPGGG